MYKGRYGEVLIDPHLYKPCCQRKPKLHQQREEGGKEEEEEEAAEAEQAEQAMEKDAVSVSPTPIPKQEKEVEGKEELGDEAR